MFKKILVALDHSKADRVLLPKVLELARLTNAQLLLLHVSTGWAAQWQKDLNLSDSPEMKEDRALPWWFGRELWLNKRSARQNSSLSMRPLSRARQQFYLGTLADRSIRRQASAPAGGGLPHAGLVR